MASGFGYEISQEEKIWLRKRKHQIMRKTVRWIWVT